MKRKLIAFTASLLLLSSMLLTSGAGAHTVVVGDSYRGEWFAKPISVKNMGTIAHDTNSRGEFTWTDQKRDQLLIPSSTQDITRAADLEQFSVTADTNNIYFLAKMEFIRNNSFNPSPEVMITIDSDSSHSSGNVAMPNSTLGINVTNSAAWEYAIQTKFTPSKPTADADIWTSVSSHPLTGTAQLQSSAGSNPGSFIEIAVPWSKIGGKPSPDKLWRFTVSTFYSTFPVPNGGTSPVVDVLTSAASTSAELADNDIDSYFDVHFNSAGEVFSPLVLTEFMAYPQYEPSGTGIDPAGEWIEIHNTTSAPLNLQSYSIGDAPYHSSSSGAMLQLPNKTLQPAGDPNHFDYAVVVNDANNFYNKFITDYNIPANFVSAGLVIKLSSLSRHNTLQGALWAPGTTLSLPRRKSDSNGNLFDFKESIALVDEADTLVDLIQYGTTGAPNGYDSNNSPIYVPLAGVAANTTFERCPSERDTNSGAFDFVFHDLISGGNPSPAAPCPLSSGVNLFVAKNVHDSQVLPGGVVVYTITWGNEGQTTATNIVLTDSLPLEVTFLGANPAPNSQSGRTQTWNLGSAVTGVNGTIVLTGTLSTSVQAGKLYENTAGIRSAEAESAATLDDNFTRASVMAIKPNLSVASANWPGDTKLPGNTFCYDINYLYSNGGTTNATNVVIRDVLPAGVKFVSQTPSPSLAFSQPAARTLQWGPTTLVNDNGGSIHVCVQVDPKAAAGVGSNIITITGSVDPSPTPGTDSYESKQLRIGAAPAPEFKVFLPLVTK